MTVAKYISENLPMVCRINSRTGFFPNIVVHLVSMVLFAAIRKYFDNDVIQHKIHFGYPALGTDCSFLKNEKKLQPVYSELLIRNTTRDEMLKRSG